MPTRRPYSWKKKIGEPLPLHWAWSSNSPDSWWDPRTIDLDTDPLDQVSWFCTAILELEHVLARDFVLTPAGFAHGRPYVDGRYVICRPPGHMSGPSQAPTNKDRIIAGQSSWERQIEKPIRFLNHLFEARRGFRAPDDIGKIDLALRRHAQSNGLGPQLPSASTGRQRLDPPGNDPGRQGMASSETKCWSQVNFLKVVEVMIQRLTKLKYDKQDNPLVQALRQKGILTPENA